MDIEIDIKPNYIHAYISGEFSLSEAKRIFLVVLDSLVKNKIDKVLFDGQEVTGTLKDMERFYYGEFAANTVKDLLKRESLHCVPKFAYVLKEPTLDPQRFGETVAINRGMIVKAFDVPEDALAWLGL